MKDDFRKILVSIIKGLIPKQSYTGTVVSVDENKLSIDVKLEGDDIVIYDVRLVPALDTTGSSIVIIPEVGSEVLVGRIANLPAANYMISCQAADKIIIRGGSLGGMIKIEELKKQMQKDTDILKALLNVITGPTIPEPGNGSPSAFQLALVTAVTGKNPGDYSDIENEKVSHG